MEKTKKINWNTKVLIAFVAGLIIGALSMWMATSSSGVMPSQETQSSILTYPVRYQQTYTIPKYIYNYSSNYSNYLIPTPPGGFLPSTEYLKTLTNTYSSYLNR